MDKLKIKSYSCSTSPPLLPDGGVHRPAQLHVLTVDQTVASPDELVNLIGVTGAGLDVFTEDGRHTEHLIAAQVIS